MMSVRSSFDRTVKGKQFEKMGESFQLGMLIRQPSKRSILESLCG